jgi:hypothetical protein
VTTLVNFAPSQTGSPPFQFSAALDGNQYTISLTWNWGSQRWFLSIVDQFGNLVVFRPLVGSPPVTPLSALFWQDGFVYATAPAFLGYHLGRLAQITISGASPAALNGVFPCTITGPSTFTYPMTTDPGQTAQAGGWSTDANLAAGFFVTSTLVFRAATQNFEINP